MSEYLVLISNKGQPRIARTFTDVSDEALKDVPHGHVTVWQFVREFDKEPPAPAAETVDEKPKQTAVVPIAEVAVPVPLSDAKPKKSSKKK